MSRIARRIRAKRRIDKYQQQQLSDLSDRVQSIISHHLTTCYTISDYPEIHVYLDNLFPDIYLSDVNIYISSREIMDKYGFKQCAGCYVPHMQVVLVKEGIEKGGYEPAQNKFDESMQRQLSVSIKVEDVIVHELIHAVSHRIGRAGNNKFVFGEEEFVYTNCVDFYRGKGMADDTIINSTFLPFCVNDVLRDEAAMCHLWSTTGIPVSYKNSDQTVIERELDKNAEFLSQAVIQVATSRAQKMIELHEKYGRQRVNTNVVPDTSFTSRAQTLDLDCDF